MPTAFALFEETGEEPFAGNDELLHPPPHRYRWHCLTCGRFVPFAGVRRLPPIPGEADDRDYQGTCKTHGRVDVTWGQQ